MIRLIVAASLGVALIASSAEAAVYCNADGTPQGCVWEPNNGWGAPGVGYVPGVGLAAVVAQAAGRRVIVWSRDAAVVAAIERDRRSPRLPAAELPACVSATTDPRRLAAQARLIVLAVASTDVRLRAREVGQVVDASHILVHAVGALAAPPGTDERVSEILAAATPCLRLGALAGPALPADLAAGQFSSMVIASRFDEVIGEARRLLNAPPHCSSTRRTT